MNGNNNVFNRLVKHGANLDKLDIGKVVLSMFCEGCFIVMLKFYTNKNISGNIVYCTDLNLVFQKLIVFFSF